MESNTPAKSLTTQITVQTDHPDYRYVVHNRYTDKDYDKMSLLAGYNLSELLDQASYNMTTVLSVDDYKDIDNLNERLEEY